MSNLLKQARYWVFDENSIFHFGEHQGKSLKTILEIDFGYILFCINKLDKFFVSVSCWNFILENHSNEINLKNKKIVTNNYMNKYLEIERLLIQNKNFIYSRTYETGFSLEEACEYHSDKCIKIVYIQNEQVIDLSQIRVDMRDAKFASNLEIRANHIHKASDYYDPNFENIQDDFVDFKIRFIDYKDMPIFRKYETSYLDINVTNFELFYQLDCGAVCVVISMDRRNVRQRKLRDYEHIEDTKVLPIDSLCAFHVVYLKFLSKEVIYHKNISDDDCEPIYNEFNFFDKALNIYSLYRSYLPNENIYVNNQLQHKESDLILTLSIDEVDELVREWYISKNIIELYEMRREQIYRSIVPIKNWRERDLPF